MRDEVNRRLVLGVAGPVLAGLLVFAAIVLPGHGLSFTRFGVAAASFLLTSLGVSALANWLLSRRQERLTRG
ncbi:hypothetical protein [Streptomyces boncukensis]|uniref:Uncharacterized protein n=1 Tax=Streptomyces boncukensis TaxID=2711219 RepID=A0A6G4WRJ4_9ACTN|nr:hypothetical protein [Streptomyces boncukensis]NGO67886.1 hypothetical protein [Streptomyces boncukensis]